MNKKRMIARFTGYILTCIFSGFVLADSGGGLWTSAGQDLKNARHQKTETKIDPDNVSSLVAKWVLTTGGDVSATPAVDGNSLYFPDFAGNLYKVSRDTGAVIWQKQIQDYSGDSRSFVRTTPAIKGDLLVFGDQTGRNFLPGGGAKIFAVNKDTGNLVWSTMIDTHPSSIITQSATVFGDTVFVGVSSYEELHAAVIPGYQCCTFRGSMAALDVNTGAVLWKTYMAPVGFTGNAIWGSSPSIDRKRNSVYIATGNNYSAPQAFLDCVEAAGDDMAAQQACLTPYPTNYFDAIVSLDLQTGAIKWATKVIPFDVWTVSCLFELPSCPDPEGPDFDFGQSPVLYSTVIGKKRTDLLGIGQKSGDVWALNPDNGDIVWNTQVSPGGVAGGMMWGSAYDGARLYVSSANSQYQPWDLIDGSSTTGGIWSALDPVTGEIFWQTANPTGFNAGGAVSVANQVLFACSQDPDGHMFAMDTATGAILWDFVSGGSCNAGAAVVNGNVYWGSGYAGFGPPNTGNDKFYAFELD